MPYIKQKQRDALDSGERGTENAGELNYALTTIILSHFHRFGENYQAINDVVGALECCKLEFQRRVVGKYEDTKIKSNGDVYVY